MSSSVVLSFKNDITLHQAANEEPVLETNFGQLPLKTFSSGIVAAIQQLSDGATESELSNLVKQRDGFEALPKFYYYLENFKNLGMICYTASAENLALATLVPMTKAVPIEFSSVNIDTEYKLSRFAYCHTQEEKIVWECPLSSCQIILQDWRAGAIMTLLAQPHNCRELAAQITGLSQEDLQNFLSLLLSAQIIEDPSRDQSLEAAKNVALSQWEFHDLLFHSKIRLGRHNYPLGKTHRFLDKIPPLPVVKPPVSSELIDLYRPDLEALKETDVPFTLVLENRSSIREHGEQAITARQLGEFLYRSARVKRHFTRKDGPVDQEVCSRPYPSGGACYELELYLAINRCDGLESGLYHYCPQSHQLEQLTQLSSAVKELLNNVEVAVQVSIEPQILIILAARFPKVSWAYQSITYSLILKNVGVVYQTFYLVATAMGLAGSALGCGNSDLFTKAAKTDYYNETSVGEFILGSLPNV